VTCIALSPDGKTLASGAEDNTIKLWDIATGQELRTLSTHHPDDSSSHGVLNIVFSPDGRMLASEFESFSDTTSNFIFYMDLWDSASGKHLRTWNNYYLWGVAFSPDSKMLAWGTSNVYWKDNNVILLDIASGRDVHTFSGHEDRVNSVAFSPDGKTLASGSDDYTIKLWDVAGGSVLSTLSNVVTLPGVRPVDISVPVISVAFSPDGKTLVSASQVEPGMSYNTISLWDVAGMQALSSLAGYTGNAYSVSFTPDGEFIVSNSGDGTFRLWGVYP
jgi:WD40 repeat protein